MCFSHSRIILETKMECHRCGFEKTNTLLYKGYRYCENCTYIIFPPRLVLTEGWGNSRLYDATRGRYLNITLQMLQSCGWFIFYSRQALSMDKSPRNQYTYYLRFTGDYRCNMINNDYAYWPLDFKMCDKVAC